MRVDMGVDRATDTESCELWGVSREKGPSLRLSRVCAALCTGHCGDRSVVRRVQCQ